MIEERTSCRPQYGLLLPARSISLKKKLAAKPRIGSLEKYLRHHALVFVAQQMTVEERYSPDDGVRKVHHKVDTSFDRDVDCIQPLWMIEALPILGVYEKVNLVNMERMDLVGVVDHSPVVECTDGYARQRRIRRTVSLSIDVEALSSSVNVTT